jgi:hypothetical protein
LVAAGLITLAAGVLALLNKDRVEKAAEKAINTVKEWTREAA